MIELTSEQEQCASAIARWLEDEDAKQVFRVEGVAGTGKSTVVMQVMSERFPKLRILYAAYTGKAALVMQRKGAEGASTIHKLIYLPAGSKNRDSYTSKTTDLQTTILQLKSEYGQDYDVEKHPDVKNLRREVKQLEQNLHAPMFRLNLDSEVAHADVVVIDECSMVGQELKDHVCSFGTKILVLGDPGQLPPIASEGAFMKGQPDFVLKEIHRQAKDSPILQLATKARLGQRLEVGTYGNCQVVNQITTDMALEADQILCGRNFTRHINNARMRELRGFSGDMPCPGEKLVCLRNNHEKGLLNGSLWTTIRCKKFSRSKYSLTVAPEEGGEPITVLAHSAYMELYGSIDDWKSKPEVRIAGKRKSGLEQWADEIEERVRGIGFEMREAESFVYGSVLTVHKSQGSQWDNVLLIDESRSFGNDARKHLYTGITRAAKKVIIKV